MEAAAPICRFRPSGPVSLVGRRCCLLPRPLPALLALLSSSNHPAPAMPCPVILGPACPLCPRACLIQAAATTHPFPCLFNAPSSFLLSYSLASLSSPLYSFPLLFSLLAAARACWTILPTRWPTWWVPQRAVAAPAAPASTPSSRDTRPASGLGQTWRRRWVGGWVGGAGGRGGASWQALLAWVDCMLAACRQRPLADSDCCPAEMEQAATFTHSDIHCLPLPAGPGGGSQGRPLWRRRPARQGASL